MDLKDISIKDKRTGIQIKKDQTVILSPATLLWRQIWMKEPHSHTRVTSNTSPVRPTSKINTQAIKSRQQPNSKMKAQAIKDGQQTKQHQVYSQPFPAAHPPGHLGNARPLMKDKMT